MDEGLYVDYEELERTRNEVIDLLNQFNDCSNSFNSKLAELKQFWDGPDYYAMAEIVKGVIDRIAGADGIVPNLMREIATELEDKHNEYRSIQNSNIGYWG